MLLGKDGPQKQGRESSDCELSLVYVNAQHNLFTDLSMVRKDLFNFPAPSVEDTVYQRKCYRPRQPK